MGSARNLEVTRSVAIGASCDGVPGLLHFVPLRPYNGTFERQMRHKNGKINGSALSNYIAPIQGRDPIYRVRAPAPFMGEGRVSPRSTINLARVVGAQWNGVQ
jgi:hypothetical protein